MDETEEDTSEENVEKVVAHMKMGFTYKISAVTLMIQSGTHSRTIHGKISPRPRYAQSSWQIRRGATPVPSVLKRITIIG